MASIVVVFDFDKTIIDCDSDNWVVDELGATDLFNELLPTMPWNTLMDTMMKELRSRGRTIEDIAECLKRAPLHPRIISAIKAAHALGCELNIVSDANTFFIETILEHHALRGYFSEIHTNPSFIDEEGTLRILPYHEKFITHPHGCSDLCAPNMCKEGKKRFIYLGDGKGDFCPSSKLGEGDFDMPRKNFPVWDLICNNLMLINAQVHGWSDGEELENILLHLIDTIIYEERNTNNPEALNLTDCKYQITHPMLTRTSSSLVA
ncbi:hypothetical protein GIB67_002496 [Kingdonia uniflora]|uniref:Uncharacterized protein n=1 Tax=Kingdonia uniflora TaxID=39325 RepID=A0A7J7LAJ8_9MAGN|nr:hypothetical protein GIB67_002496 [Kingdonia uniflora]